MCWLKALNRDYLYAVGFIMDKTINKVKTSNKEQFNKVKQFIDGKNFSYWPRINFDLLNIASSCAVCLKHQRYTNTRDPLMSNKISNVPFFKLVADVAE